MKTPNSEVDPKCRPGRDRKKRIKKELWEKQGNTVGHLCVFCHKPFQNQRAATLDRIVPGYYGGCYTEDNLVLACKHCNDSRGHIEFLEFWINKRSS